MDWGVTTLILATRMLQRKVLATDSWDPKYHRLIMPDGDVSTAEDKYEAVLELAAQYDVVRRSVEVIV